MLKGIIIDMGDTIVRNENMDFVNALSKFYDLSNYCKSDKLCFVIDGLKILKNIFKERDELEFRMIDYLQYLINYFEMKFSLPLKDVELEFARSCSTVKKVDNIDKILKYFKNKNYKMILLSNTSFSKKVIITMLGDLVSYFDEIIVSSESVFRKPNNNFFELAISKMEIEKDKIYYIGNDYYYDVYGSTNAGIKSVWFNEQKVKPNLELGHIDYLEISNYIELIEMDF